MACGSMARAMAPARDGVYGMLVVAAPTVAASMASDEASALTGTVATLGMRTSTTGAFATTGRFVSGADSVCISDA